MNRDETKREKWEELLEKIKKAHLEHKLDLSTDEDLSIGVMNLVSLEEHFFFTAEKTKKDDYLDLLEEVRGVRKSLLAKLMPVNEGESWCITKHLLASTMRLIEVGTKLDASGRREDAKASYDAAFKLYSLFWALRLKLVDASNIKKAKEEGKPLDFESIMTELINCCEE